MHLDLAELIDAYGYIALAVGAFLEGETVLVLAGLAAHRGYLDLRVVIVVAAICGFAGDQFYFFLGRRHGAIILARYPAAQESARRFDALLARWHAPLIVAIRFMYGFRIVGPLLLGMGRVHALKFVTYNAIGAVIWACLVAGLGYAFGRAMEALLHYLKHFEIWGLVVLLSIAVVVLIALKLRDMK